MHGRRTFWSAVQSFLLVSGALFVSPPPAGAQTPAPWSGVAADEAKVPGPFNYGSNDMSPRSLSADGRFVVFHSNLPNLVPDDTNNWNDVFLRDRVTRELTRVSVSSAGVEANNWSAYPSISADGRHISFYSYASNLVAGDTNDMPDFFVRDRELGTTVRVSVGPNGEESTSLGAFYQARLSADGRYVVFAAQFGSGTPMHAWIHDRDTDGNGVFDEPGLASTTQIPTELTDGNRIDVVVDAAISNDARFVALVGETCNDPCSNYIGYRMYVHDRISGQTFRVDRPAAGYFDENAYSFSPDFSDTALLTYTSTQPNLVEGVVNPDGEIYVFNLITGGNVHVNPNVPSLDYKQTPQISADGRYIAFLGTAWNFGNPAYNVYAYDRQTLTTTLVSVHAYYGYADDHASVPSMTADGSGIAFAAEPGIILEGAGSMRGIFVATSVALTPAETEVPEVGGTYTIEVTAPATTGWELFYGPNTIVNPSSGTGSATVTVEIAANTSPDDVTSFVTLGSEQVTFHQTTPPQVWYAMPWEGPTAGGTDVDIFGAGFAPGMTVEFGGTAATNVTFIDSGHIVATTPAHFGGWVSVKVTKATGTSDEVEYMFYFDDQTAPIVTSQVTGTLGANGWYTGDVTVTWTVVEDESQLGTEPCLPFSQTTDVELVFVGCYAESAGGSTFAELEIRRDTQPPMVSLVPAYPDTYAQGEQMPISIYCTDDTSGVNPVNCTMNQAGPYLDTSTVGTFVLSGTAVDMAGHTTTTSTSYTVKMWTGLTVPVATSVYGDASASLRATLNGPVTPLAGRTITFFVDNVAVGTAVTAANGEAILSFPLNGLNARSYEMHADFAGDDTAFPSMLSSALMLYKATPVVTWANPSFIVAGTPLGSAQLNATASVPGSFIYQPGFWAVLAAGTHTLSADFTPQDQTNYQGVSKTVTLKVKAIPVITWPAPAAITYPTILTATQLNATANTAGSFVYTPPFGTLLDAGTQTISVTFSPSNTADYVDESATTTIEVLKATATIDWPNINPITFGLPLSGLQLNATTSAIGGGSFTYAPPYGTILNAGTHTLTATFSPNPPYNYHPATATREIVVNKAYPVVYWQGDLAPIVYGTPLDAAQLYATSPNAGTITYDPPAGTLLEAGLRTISMTFTPDDPANYHTVTYQKQIAVDKQTTTITWNEPAQIAYGTALSAAQLNATATQPGTLTYDPPAGTVLTAGPHQLSVYFAPTSPNYYGGTRYVTLLVEKRTPVITWSNPAPIVYGTALSNTQLNVSANVPGALTYTPAAGMVLGAGTQLLVVTFEPSDPANNNAASASTTIVVNPAAPVVSWANPPNIVYGAALSAAELNATANVPGTFEYSPPWGTLLTAGPHALSVTFTPTDAANYTTATAGASITVDRATPAITWANPAGITYGTALSGTQLNAATTIPGTFAYSPAAGFVLDVGNRTLSVTFTPDDAANYTAAGTTVTIAVGQATPGITWPASSAITYGTALSATQLNATANVAGTFAYNYSTGTVLGAGSHTLSVAFTPSDTANYTSAAANVTLDVNKATPVITWNTPNPVTYGTALSSTQLNATANVPGSFAYNPAAGAVLGAGSQTLSVTFTPNDTANYDTAVATVTLAVGKASPVLTWPLPANITYGTALSSTQLNATANVPGTFAYAPAAGTVLAAGPQSLFVAFTPTDSANYNETSLWNGIFVAKAALTIQTDNATKVYGQALPAFTASGTGFVNGDSMASLSGTLSFSTSATATSAPGSYTVTPSGVTSANYNISFLWGMLTINKASTSVAFTTTPNPSNHNQQVQLRAVVSAVAPGAGTATGTVEFREGTTLLGTATLVNGVATMNKSFKRGTHSLTATYVGNTNFNGSSGSVTHQVN